MICKAFQPIWGTLKSFDESKRPTTPGIKPRPFTETHVKLLIEVKGTENGSIDYVYIYNVEKLECILFNSEGIYTQLNSLVYLGITILLRLFCILQNQTPSFHTDLYLSKSFTLFL